MNQFLSVGFISKYIYMSYEDKYLKYKNKYLSLKESIEGGGMNSITDKNEPFISGQKVILAKGVTIKDNKDSQSDGFCNWEIKELLNPVGEIIKVTRIGVDRIGSVNRITPHNYFYYVSFNVKYSRICKDKTVEEDSGPISIGFLNNQLEIAPGAERLVKLPIINKEDMYVIGDKVFLAQGVKLPDIIVVREENIKTIKYSSIGIIVKVFYDSIGLLYDVVFNVTFQNKLNQIVNDDRDFFLRHHELKLEKPRITLHHNKVSEAINKAKTKFEDFRSNYGMNRGMYHNPENQTLPISKMRHNKVVAAIDRARARYNELKMRSNIQNNLIRK